MTKKRSIKDDYVAFRYSIDALDSGRSKAEVLGTLIEAAESGSGVIPNGWQVTWRWQNKKDGRWREDSFNNTVSNSRGGFLLLMGRRLRRDYRAAVGREFSGVPIREATEPEEEELEELSEELEEERRGREHRASAAKKRRRHAKKRKVRKVSKHRRKVSKVRKGKSGRKSRRRRRKAP